MNPEHMFLMKHVVLFAHKVCHFYEPGSVCIAQLGHDLTNAKTQMVEKKFLTKLFR